MFNILDLKTLKKFSIAYFIFVITLSIASCSSYPPSLSNHCIELNCNLHHHNIRYVKQVYHQGVAYYDKQASHQSKFSFIKKVNDQKNPAKKQSDYSKSLEEKNKAGIKPPIEHDLPEEED